jgi:hypothetical protein
MLQTYEVMELIVGYGRIGSYGANQGSGPRPVWYAAGCVHSRVLRGQIPKMGCDRPTPSRTWAGDPPPTEGEPFEADSGSTWRERKGPRCHHLIQANCNQL